MFVLLAVACSTPPSYVPPASEAGTDAGPSTMSACTALATAACTKLEACSNLSLVTRYGSLATCETRLAASCTVALRAPSTGNSADRAQACADAYPSWNCGDYLDDDNVPMACTQPTGKLANGATCAFSAQCSTAFCAIPPSAACGTCAAPPRDGDSCANLSTCGQGLVCFAASKVCGTLGATGASCSKNAPCQAHLSCIGANSAKGILGTCQASAAVSGVACEPDLAKGPGCDYQAGLTCNAKSKTCESVTTSTAGGPCDLDNDQFAACAASGTCSASEAGAMGTCRAAAADGAACTTTSAGPACIPPARCVVATSGSTSGTCQVAAAAACK